MDARPADGDGMSAPIPFVEADCRIGGCACGAWEDWFIACDDADPDAISVGRDPAELTDRPFDPASCAKPGTCKLYERATS